MKTLTLIQPWATLIALNEKHIETRSWATTYRGPLLIHAGQKVDRSVWRLPCFKEILDKYGITPDNIPTSAIIAQVQLTDVQPTEELIDSISTQEKAFGFYDVGRFGWILQNTTQFNIPDVKGHLGLWEYKLD